MNVCFYRCDRKYDYLFERHKPLGVMMICSDLSSLLILIYSAEFVSGFFSDDQIQEDRVPRSSVSSYWSDELETRSL